MSESIPEFGESSRSTASQRGHVRAALAALGIERLVLTVHDASFPAGPGEDVGRGTPYSRAASAFFETLSAQGFDGVQLGPQGQVTHFNPSPYDGSWLGRSHLCTALGPLVDEPGLAGLLTGEELARAVAQAPAGSDRWVDHRHAWVAIEGALRIAHRRFLAAPQRFAALETAQESFLRENDDWLAADALFDALAAEAGTDDPAAFAPFDQRLCWPSPPQRERARQRRAELQERHRERASFASFVQLLLAVQHAQLRCRLRRLPLRLYADLQVGTSLRDRFRHGDLFLPGYAMGAPPSRTNTEGQAWGYAVLDPAGLEAQPDGVAPALALFDRRLRALLDDFDGIRIDHPHGIVCPWVYRANADDALCAVRAGARLYESPHLPDLADSADHAELARHAIVAATDLTSARSTTPRWAEEWVVRLSEAQVDRYARLFERIMNQAAARGIDRSDICAEVLSTCPYPLERVLGRYGLGKVRVLQKADPDDEQDVYRTANSSPEDWVTLGTHDTPPIALTIDEWSERKRASWARYLAQRLAPDESQRSAWGDRIARDPISLRDALAADLFVGPARHVSLFFPDLLGLREIYNVPGTVGDHNWSLRVPPDFAEHSRAVGIDVAAAVAMALQARARGADGDLSALARRLAPPG